MGMVCLTLVKMLSLYRVLYCTVLHSCVVHVNENGQWYELGIKSLAMNN